MIRLTPVLAMVLAAHVMPVPGLVQGQDFDKTREEQAVRDVVLATEEAFNMRDFAAVANLYVEDGDWMVLDDSKASGREAIQNAIEKRWATVSVTRVSRFQIDEVRFLGDDVAIVDVTASFSDGRAPTRPVYVMVRRDGKWLVAATRVLPGEK